MTCACCINSSQFFISTSRWGRRRGRVDGADALTLKASRETLQQQFHVGIGLDVGDYLSWTAKRDAALAITRITDGKTFEDDMALVGPGGAISVWATGLGEAATSADVSLRLNGTTLPAIWLAPASNGAPRQINALLPAGLETGPAAVSVVHAGKETPPRHVRLTHLRLA